jgi:bisanhydrobacterioruberin hydratase
MKTFTNGHIAKTAIVIWYLVGISGFMIRPLQPLFQKLTPFGMVMAATLLMFFHEPKDRKSALVFSGIIVFGFLIEVVGVNTQAIFGTYLYGDSLGPKLWDTPLIIGLNWLVLIYCISALAKPIRETWYFPLVGAATMVAFDWLMEPVAMANDMWNWGSGVIPNKNYIDWFLVSGVLFLLFRILKVEINNRIAGILFAMQVVFFLVLNILSRT